MTCMPLTLFRFLRSNTNAKSQQLALVVGNSRPEDISNDNQNTPKKPMSMMSLAKALRGKQPECRRTSNITTMALPSTREERPEENCVNVVVGYEDCTSIPYTADRKSAMRLLTRKGDIIENNPYRLHGIPDGTEPEEQRRTKDDFEVIYHSDVLPTIDEERADPHEHERESSDFVEEARTIPYLDEATLARLDGVELFPPDDDEWEHVNDRENILVSRFSPWDSEASSSKKGIFRSLSKRVKGSLRRSVAPARPDISAPLLDLRHEPEGPAGLPNAMEYAIPIENPAPELANRAGNIAEAIGIRRQNTIKLATRPSKPDRQPYGEKAMPPTRPARPRKVKVVGEEDRMTEMGDFIDAGLADSSSEELVEVEDSYDQEHTILKIRSLHPLRKPRKKVDTSKYDWMPPVPPILPMPPKVTSQHDWHMSQQYPTIDSLFDEVDKQIADIASIRHERAAASREVDRSPSGTVRIDDNDSDNEIMVDTYVHDDHTLWVASERPNADTACSTRRVYRQERQRKSAEGDEAAARWVRLQALRK